MAVTKEEVMQALDEVEDPELNISWELNNDKIKQSTKDAKLAYL